MSKRQMHLAGFMHASQVVHSHPIWRHPKTHSGFLTPEYYQNVARILEQGKFDLVFFADILATPDRYGNPPLKRGARGDQLLSEKYCD